MESCPIKMDITIIISEQLPIAYTRWLPKCSSCGIQPQHPPSLHDVELTVLGCRLTYYSLGTNCDQCQSMVQCCFMSTETVRLIRTESLGQPPQLSRSSWTPTSFLTKWDDLLQQPSVLPGAYWQHEDATRSPVKAHHQLWLRPGSGQLSFRAVHDTINSLGKAICAPPHLSAVQKQSAITAAHLPSLSWVPWWPWGSAVESPHWECPVPSDPHLSESGMPPYPPAHTKSYIFGTRLL